MTARPGTIFSAGEETADFELPYLREKPEPVVYPRWAVARGWNGEVVLAVEILPDGRVGRWQVMKSSGRKMLDLAAVKAVRKWRFAPAKKGGRPILSCIQVPVYFKIV
ncbi:MAG: energy transducer TonB [Candidatus Omnitrophica bacterium]|nr:energy transducer TonB [Candidatus Omnitrophota bacterium]